MVRIIRTFLDRQVRPSFYFDIILIIVPVTLKFIFVLVTCVALFFFLGLSGYSHPDFCKVG